MDKVIIHSWFNMGFVNGSSVIGPWDGICGIVVREDMVMMCNISGYKFFFVIHVIQNYSFHARLLTTENTLPCSRVKLGSMNM
jgi:hypothetical protein